MKKTTAIMAISLLVSCTGFQKKQGNTREYVFTGSSKTGEPSKVTIDNCRTYKKDFKLLGNTQCIEISLKTVNTETTFPFTRSEVNNFFYVEKFFKINNDSTKVYRDTIGKNYNREWQSFTPVQICGRRESPLSKLEKGNYRIIFTTTTTNPFYYEIKIKSPIPISFQD